MKITHQSKEEYRDYTLFCQWGGGFLGVAMVVKTLFLNELF
jgi:hypothetical protein